MPSDTKEDQPISEMLKPTENDVYPLSIFFTRGQKLRMKISRIVVFILCFYFVIPFDLYIPAHHRIYYFGTDVYKVRVPYFNDNSTYTANYTFNLENCKVYFYQDTSAPPQGISFFMEYGFTFGTNNSMSNSILSITASPDETCIVNLFLPLNLSLPAFTFNINGTQDNMMFDDSNL